MDVSEGTNKQAELPAAESGRAHDLGTDLEAQVGSVDLSLIVLNFNTHELAVACVRSIYEHLRRVTYEVIVVDNGSTDKSAEALAASLPTVNLVRSEWNRGFAGGNNLGAKVARGRYFAFLNSDTLLVDDSLASLIGFADKHPEIGILSPVLYLEDGKTIQSTAIAGFQTLLSVVTRSHTRHVINLGREFQYVDLVAGAAMVVRRGLFEELGGFDEGIFMYLEDDDICKRAADLGMRTAVYARAGVIHLGGRSISMGSARKRIYDRSQNYYWLKHHGLLPTLVMRCLRLPYRLVRERWE